METAVVKPTPCCRTTLGNLSALPYISCTVATVVIRMKVDARRLWATAYVLLIVVCYVLPFSVV